MTVYLNSLAPVADINSYAELCNESNARDGDGALTGAKVKNLTNPEVFYSTQLLDTIRIDSDQCKYYKLADEMPINNKADKLLLRRWAPLQAHTVPLDSGVPPKSDKGSVKKYELEAKQYGRYMEFTDKVDFQIVDPVIVHYTREYSLVAIETLDMLAREALFTVAQKYYAGSAANVEAMDTTSIPTITDLRVIILTMKKALIKPRSNGKFKVIAGPEFFYDMVSDPTVEDFMVINQTTKNMYDGSGLFPMFGMEFDESMHCPSHGQFKDIVGGVATDAMRVYRIKDDESIEFATIYKTTPLNWEAAGGSDPKVFSTTSGYVQAELTGKDASYIPNNEVWNIDGLKMKDAGDVARDDWKEFKIQHVLIVGKEALARTGLTGEGQARVYAKPKGSAGVLDPIDQRQSIGFKINSVGFGSTRPEAVYDYLCVPTQLNI